MTNGDALRDLLTDNAIDQLGNDIKPALVRQIVMLYRDRYGRQTGKLDLEDTPQKRLRDALTLKIHDGVKANPDDAAWYSVGLTWVKEQFTLDDDSPWDDQTLAEIRKQAAEWNKGLQQPDPELLDGDDETSWR